MKPRNFSTKALLDNNIQRLIVQCQKVKARENFHFRNKAYRELDRLKQIRLNIYKQLDKICPHDQGRTEPSYWNDGVKKCNRCGNSEDSLTNGFVDGWDWN